MHRTLAKANTRESMSSKAIVVVGNGSTGFQVTQDSEAKRLREELLAKAAKVIKIPVTDADSQAVAVRMAGELKGLDQAIEDNRAAVKEPFFRTGQKIDTIARELKKPVQEAISSIESLLASYQRKLDQEAERRRQEQERQRQEQERQRLEAEERARQAQAALDAAQASGEDTTQAEIDAAEAADDANEVASAEPAPIEEIEDPKVRGAAVKRRVTFVVTDYEALYAWDKKRREEGKKKDRNLPTFITMEVKKKDFTQFINMLDDEGRAQIPGVTITEETKIETRAIAPVLSIQ